MIVEADFLDHPKTLKLVRLLGAETAPLLLIRLWAFCQHRKTDQLPGDPEDIAVVCRYPGAAAELITALERCGWIEKNEAGGWVARGWVERNAAWLGRCKGGKTRAKNAERDADGHMKAANSAGSSSSSPASCQLAGSCESGSSEVAGRAAGADEMRRDENIPLSSPSRGQGVSASAGAEGQTIPLPSPAASAEKKETGGRGESEGAALLEDAKRRIGALFGRQKLFFGVEAERALAELVTAGVLPLPEEDWRLLAWWFELPKDERDSDLRNRRQHAETLACNLLAEIDRARGYAKKTGAPVAEKKTPGLDLAKFQAWHRRQYPEVPVPCSLEGVSDWILNEAKAALAVA